MLRTLGFAVTLLSGLFLGVVSAVALSADQFRWAMFVEPRCGVWLGVLALGLILAVLSPSSRET
jgi:hypothetical protein